MSRTVMKGGLQGLALGLFLVIAAPDLDGFRLLAAAALLLCAIKVERFL